MEQIITTRFRLTPHGAAGQITIIETLLKARGTASLQHFVIHNRDKKVQYDMEMSSVPLMEGLNEFVAAQLTETENVAFDTYIFPIQAQFPFPITWTFQDAADMHALYLIGLSDISTLELIADGTIDPTLRQKTELIAKFLREMLALD